MKASWLGVFAVVAVIVAGTQIGCSSKPSQPQSSAEKPVAAVPAQPKQPILYTGEEASSRMLGFARAWAPDVQLVRLESELTSETTGQGGKSTLWRGVIASARRQEVKTFVCSGSRDPNAPPMGVSANPGAIPYSAQVAAMAFQPFLLKTDSDKAFAIAQEHGGANILKEDAQQPVTYYLAFDPKQRVPLWYVVYGTSDKDRKGIGVINATTGTFLRAAK